MDRVIFVSGDSHATPPPEVWSDYIESKYHGLLPSLHEDNERYVSVSKLFADYSPEALEVIDTDGAIGSGGLQGVWDGPRRVAEMDREGVAAEIVYFGDPRAIPLFHSGGNRQYSSDVNAAGVRAYHRWAADTFRAAHDRIMLMGDAGPCTDLDETLVDMNWIADHGFLGTLAPGNTGYPDMPPLFDPYFEPFWSVCEERGLTLAIHAGHGMEQGAFLDEIDKIIETMRAEGRSDLLAEIVSNTENSFFALDLRPRRAMWQMMLGGVFDRHPNLKLMMTEVRADWLPATLRYLDGWYERTEAPAKRRPSEYWQSNCLAGVSSVHKVEVEMRHEIGVETMMFGRDYPHAEGTWPNTKDWLTDAFAGVPHEDVRLILGENAIRFLGLDRDMLASVADRIGPTMEDITGRDPSVDARRLAHFDARAAYLRPAEEISPAAIDDLLIGDLEKAGAG